MSEANTLSPRAWLLLALTSLALFLPGFATLPPVDRDEGRYIVSSQRMAESGDFIDIRYQDEPRYLQPAGIYWLQSLSTLALDSPGHHSVWSYRVPSLLAALLAVLLTGFVGARFFGAKAGLIAGILLAVCVSLNFEARIAKTDAALLACIVAAQLTLMRLYTEPDAKRWLAAVFWAALGAGLMIKGPIILIVVAATIAALLAWDRKFAWLARLRPLSGPLIMLAIALPWYIAIGLVSDGEFYNRAVGQSMLDKVGDSQQGHSGPPGYHLALLALMFWPGSLIGARAVLTAWRRRGEPAVRFLICWAAPTWIIFEIVATKLPHYVLPTYPALACLCALALADPAPARGVLARSALVVWSIVWAAATIGIVLIGPAGFHEFDMPIPVLTLVLAALTALTAAAALWFFWRRETTRTIAALAAASVLGVGGLFGASAPNLDAAWLSPRIDALARELRPCTNSVLITVPYSEPSLVFLYGRTRTQLASSPADAAERLALDPSCGLALVGGESNNADTAQREFLARATALGVKPRALTQISGRNYSNGDTLVLTLHSADNRNHARQ